MSEIELLGRTSSGLRIAAKGQTALAPEALLADELGPALSDSTAEEWAAAMSYELAGAIEALTKGDTPKAPFDRLILEREA